MAGARDVKRRIRSVDNTRQITRTMELVATSKLKRATDRVHAARPFSDKDLLVLLNALGESESRRVCYDNAVDFYRARAPG